MCTLLRTGWLTQALRTPLGNATGSIAVRRSLASGVTTTTQSDNKKTDVPSAGDTVHIAKSKEWRTIYRLPLIRIASAFNRLKIYQAALTLTGTPAAFALEQAGHTPPLVASIFGIVGVTGFITLTLGSYAIRNLIGIIYINEAEDQLKVAYIDFWGRRQHAILIVDELIPAWEQARPTRFDFFQPVQVESNTKRRFKLLHRFGVVTEPETFVTLFGE